MKYIYKALTQAKIKINGEIEAANESEVIDFLHSKCFIPIEIKLAQQNTDYSNSAQKNEFIFLKVSKRDSAIFFRQFAAMINAGITVIASLDAISSQITDNRRLHNIIARINEKIIRGLPLSNAFSAESRYFDPCVVPILKAGEESGMLGKSLDRIAIFLEEKANFQEKIISAATYPFIVTATAFIVLLVMTVLVIPQFYSAFSVMGIELPAITKLTFTFSIWLRANWYLIPVAVILFLLSLRIVSLSKDARQYIDAFTLKIPLLGKIKYKISLARAFETFSLLLIAGVPMLTVIELAADAAGNFKVKEKFLELRSGVERGKKLNEIANEKKLFPPIVCQMINVGEKTGRTPQMLSKIAEWYNNELAETIKRLSMRMEPIMIIIVGIIIGFLVFSVFMPVISAANTYL